MGMSVLLIARVLYISMCIYIVYSSDDKFLEVISPAGTFKGTALLSLQGHIYTAYSAIPYALPPVGRLRFAKPKPYPKMEHVFDATHIAPTCIQPSGIDLGSPSQEDCLYLNVYVPDQDTEVEPILKKVFVFIHGGGFFMGSSREYMPGDLVAVGDVLVVTFNYRLSWLGFVKGNTSELPGNQGMWDQLMALQWVKDNIKSFGGDPEDITVGGNSMGSESISALSIIPHGMGLFTKALLMSGAMFSSPSTPGSSDVLLDLLTDRVGCKVESIDDTVRCLRELPADKFILPVEGRLTNKFTTIDLDLFPFPITDLIKDKEYLRKVGFYNRDYIVSLTNNEGAVEFFGPFDLGADPDTMSASFLSQKFNIPVSVCEKILAWYQQPDHFTFNPAYDILDDYILAAPTYKFLQVAVSDINETGQDKNGNSYFLYFDHLPSYLPSALQGICHGMDLMYLFDLQPDQMLQYYYNLHTSEEFSDVDFQMKNTYIGMLTDFMKSGDPSVTLREKFNIQWSAFDLKSENCLSFGPIPSVKPSPLKERMLFWNKLYPQYLKDHAKSHQKQEL